MSPLRNTAPAPTQRRHMARVVTALGSAVAAGLTGLATACADGPTAPAARPAYARTASSTSTSGTGVNALLWNKAASQTTVSAVIGPNGGSLAIPNGVKMTVPRGAVLTNVTFSITRLPGNIVAYDFQPHGTQFAQPLTIEQPTLGTNLLKLPDPSVVEGGYFADASTLNQTTGTAVVNEFQSTSLSPDKAWISFTVWHFSGYLMSTGRQ